MRFQGDGAKTGNIYLFTILQIFHNTDWMNQGVMRPNLWALYFI